MRCMSLSYAEGGTSVNGLMESIAEQEWSASTTLFHGPEIGLAETIQKTLVPSVIFKNQHVEAHGRALPLHHLGGDLLDLVADYGKVTAYVADVCGHGIRAGLLMGMLKTAMRYGLLLRQSLPALLESMNRVLPAVKESSMYATLAALRFDGAGKAEYVSAGHPPLLHYRRRQKDVVRCRMAQFPLG
jgi:phosphoserine phosphatase RsbU/P